MIQISKPDCCGCMACMKKCPSDAITEIIDNEGFRYPHINPEKCTECGCCEKVCPVLKVRSQKITNSDISNEVYAAFNKTMDIRRQSSSGGIFDALARKIIEKKGVVYGAAMTDDLYGCSHIKVESIENLSRLHGSKYIQSDITGSYDEIEALLKQGRLVLFSGTPCQINALKEYISCDSDNLYCVEVVCHGVPSEFYWKKYLNEIEEKHRGKVVHASFRNKNDIERASSRDGWGMKLAFDNGKVIVENSLKNRFLQAFIHNVILRPSCYSCAFKYIDREADITLGDFWGCGKIHKGFDDGKGVSLVITHSKKGEELIRELREEINYEKSNIEYAVAFNSPLVSSVVPHKNRARFIENVSRMGFIKASDHVLRSEMLIDSTKCYIKKLIKR